MSSKVGRSHALCVSFFLSPFTNTFFFIDLTRNIGGLRTLASSSSFDHRRRCRHPVTYFAHRFEIIDNHCSDGDEDLEPPPSNQLAVVKRTVPDRGVITSREFCRSFHPRVLNWLCP